MHGAKLQAVSPGRFGGPFLAVLAVMLLLPAWTQAQPARKDGLFLTVPNPITDNGLQQIKLKIGEAFQKGRKINTLVFDFNPNGQPSGTSNFGACYELARLIHGLQVGYQQWPPVTTVAFVSNEVTQHTVLPVLACRQIVMSGATDEKSLKIKARIGDIQRGQDKELEETEKSVYRKLAREAGLGDLVERMFNKDIVLKKVKTTEDSKVITTYLSSQTIARLEKEGKILEVQKDLPPGLEPGSALFDAELAQRLGLYQALYNSRAELATALHLPRQSLSEDWLAGRTPIVWRIEVKGSLDKGSLDSLERRIKSAISRNANFLILQMEGSGGDTKHVASLANWIRTLTDQNLQPVKTVAYLPASDGAVAGGPPTSPRASLGAATFLALGCSEIIMGDDAVLGDFSYLRDELPEDLQKRRTMMVPLAREQGYPPLLFEATLDARLVLYRVRSRIPPEEEKLLAEEEFKKDQASKEPRWLDMGRIDKPEGQFLKINANLAREWGVAQAGHFPTVDAVYAYYGLDAPRVRVARDDWLDKIAEFFREPVVNFLLVMLGIIGLILELKMPGASVPGIMAAVCFVLFFWSYSFVGEFTLLAVLLFILGLVLLGVEIFVLPGLGFTGISGLVLVITSLALVTLERWPTTPQEWIQLGATLGSFGLSLVMAIIGAVMVAWYLPSIPYANRLVLKPPEEEQEPEPTVPASLLGAIGMTATPLRPAGKAQFGDDFLDVIGEGDFVNAGRRVQVIEIEGNRIVVKEV